jgi:malonyl-ACP O-methyltransferase BioC
MSECVFLNGWAADAAAFDRVRAALPPECGAGPVFSWIDQLADEKGTSPFERSLTAAGRPALLVAWSLGTMTAIRAAAEHPDKVSGLVLVSGSPRLTRDPASRWPGVAPAMVKAMKLMIRVAPDKVFHDFLKAASQPQPLPEDKRKIQATPKDIDAMERGLELLLKGDVRESFGRIPAPMPVSILHDRDDAIIPVAAAEALAQIRPSVRILLTAGLGHLTPIRAPEKIAALVSEQLGTGRITASFDNAAPTYDHWARHHTEIAKKLVAEIPEGKYPVAADIGCGTGILTGRLQMRFSPRRLYAVDLSKAMLEAGVRRVPSATPVQADAQTVRLPDKADLIASACAFQWVADYAALLTNLRANLTPGGTLAVAELLEDNLPELRAVQKETGIAPAPLPYRSEPTIRSALAAAGFRLSKAFRGSVTVWYPDAMTALKSFSKIGADISAIYGTERIAPTILRRLLAAYDKQFRTERGVPLTYSVFYYFAALERGLDIV